MQFRKKPVVISAVQFVGNNALEIFEFTNGKSYPTDDSINHHDWPRKKLVIPTLEGEMIASYQDWIIKGVKGEFYPCKPDIFAATYESPESLAPDYTWRETQDSGELNECIEVTVARKCDHRGVIPVEQWQVRHALLKALKLPVCTQHTVRLDPDTEAVVLVGTREHHSRADALAALQIAIIAEAGK